VQRSRLLHLERASGKFTDGSFRDFLSWLRDDDLLVFNDSRVIPARLLVGEVECTRWIE